MSIACIGDVHRSFREFQQLVAGLPEDVEAIIQVGDLGLEPADCSAYPPSPRLARPVWYVDGNWDHFGPWRTLGRTYRQLQEPTLMLSNLTYVPAGCVLTLAGRRVGFLGGAESRARLADRHPGLNWWPAEEGVPAAGVARLLAAAAEAPIDLLITHQPPAAFLREVYGDPDHGHSPSARTVQAVWDRLGRPPLVAGHLHRASQWTGVRVLGELEVALLP